MKIETERLESPIDSDIVGILRTIEGLGVFDADCFIAGGYARQVAHRVLNEKSLKACPDYFGRRHRRTAFRSHTPGDVDIFMPPDGLNETLPASIEDALVVSKLRVFDSIAGFAKNVGLNESRIAVQFVTKPAYRYHTVEACFDNFDLVNSRYAITRDPTTKQFILHWDPDALQADMQTHVKIANTTSPFLGSRVLKYIRYRNCGNGLDDGSIEPLRAWLLQAAVEKWPEGFSAKHLRGISHQVQKLRQMGLVDSKDLVFFLGKWNVTVKEAYGISSEVDWAINEIGES